MQYQFAPFGDEELKLSDEDLGERLMDWAIAHKAAELGLDPWNVPHGFVDACEHQWRQIPNEPPSAEYSAVLLAVQYGANHNFEAAGRVIRDHVARSANQQSAFRNIEHLIRVYTGEADAGEHTLEVVTKLAPELGDHIKQVEAQKRRERVYSRVEELRSKGSRNFLQQVANEEGISVPRIKQLLDEYKKSIDS